MPCLMRPDTQNFMKKDISEMDLSTVIMEAVRDHPLLMSPLLLEYFLRGEIIGRMEEKGLIDSQWYGVLSEENPHIIAEEIKWLLKHDHLKRSGGFYPALKVNDTVQTI